MKLHPSFRLAILATALFAGSSQLFAAEPVENVTLDDLKKAFAKEETPTETRKVRTRAIVFDNQASQDSPAPASAAPAPGSNNGISVKINFAPGSAKVSSESLRNLEVMAQFFKLDQSNFVIEGHTDSIGNPDKNKLLSEARANSVKDFLVKQGIPAERLSAVGKGSSEPLEGEDPKSAKNRRVQIKKGS
ncbi:MAG: hypothetical protein RIR00_232 [Pseudomonadota bacterium]|jgi:outer membrane protein OmpA-like peptidoglycan-associated protein